MDSYSSRKVLLILFIVLIVVVTLNVWELHQIHNSLESLLVQSEIMEEQMNGIKEQVSLLVR